MKRKIVVIGRDLFSIISKYFNFREDIEVCTFDFLPENLECDLLILYDYNSELSENVFDNFQILNVHPSLLPAFSGQDSIKRAYASGVKVSGVTVHRVQKDIFDGQILAQYPVLIGNTTHFDEFCNEIHSVEAFLVPKVVEAVLEDRVFDFGDLFAKKCSSGCRGCGGCSK